MLKKLQRELTLITMSLTGLVLILALGSTLVANWTTQTSTTWALLSKSLADGYARSARMGDSGFGPGGADSMLVITVDANVGGIMLSKSDSPIDIDSDLLDTLLYQASCSTETQGTDYEHHLAWMKKETSWGYRIAICDTRGRDTTFFKQLGIDAVIVVCSMLALWLVVRELAKRAVKPVEVAWDQQRRFISDASHELKTPLAVIIANLQILQKDKGVPADSKHWIDITADEASHMKTLVEDLLTLARADENKASGATAKPQMVEFSLTDAVDNAVLEFDALAFERGCSIEADLQADVTVTGDKVQLERVAKTLLDNATKYSEKGKAVKVTLKKTGKNALLEVNNSGPTIAQKDLDHLFDRFYRTDEARTRQQTGGFGLGLAIAKSIVDSHGGKIWATSSAGEGTTFHVFL